jgi:hypothetical protein
MRTTLEKRPFLFATNLPERVFGNYDPPLRLNLPKNGAGCNGMLPLAAFPKNY